MPNHEDAVKEAFAQYLRDLREFTAKEKTEHTDRAVLERLLRAFADQAEGKPKVQHEPKRIADKGAPDFKVTKAGMIVGYVENKKPGENLDKVLKSDQIAKYKTLRQNIILTDYCEFIWIGAAGAPKRAALCNEDDLENRKFKPREDRVEAVAKLLEGFFSTAPEGIDNSQRLALALARRAHVLRDGLTEELVRQLRDNSGERLLGLYNIFKTQVFHALTTQEFADAFAQMLVYGLFLAKLNAKPNERITLENARASIPGSFRLIRELVSFLDELEKDEYVEIRWVIEEVLLIVNELDVGRIHEDLSFRGRKAVNRNVRARDEEEHRLFERDPFIYFYEDFLRAYDKATSKGRGVYYTPPPVVSFIVRAVDDILKTSFGIDDGLADSRRVTVLDFACGTGTFLLEVFQRIFDNIGGPDSSKAKKVVAEHILQHLYGFEYLLAPYTIAHLKLSQYLHDKGHPLKGNERLQVFLTNTLEPVTADPDQAKLWPVPALATEIKEADAVKKKQILVITGNPPYSGHSKNEGFKAEIGGYKYTIEKDEQGRDVQKPLGERNPKYLQDDYVKFIRFAQLKMDEVEEGVVGIITNHSWLDNPTFRGMRQSLMRSFQQIYVLDLHGNAKKKERAPDGSKDENIFDIEQGVAISLFVKKPDLGRGIWHGDMWGKRLNKYVQLAEYEMRKVAVTELNPSAPLRMFIPKPHEGFSRNDWRLTDIFDIKTTGMKTHRDDFAVGFQRTEVERRLKDLLNQSGSYIYEKYKLNKTASWSAEAAKLALAQLEDPIHVVQRCYYRPFDIRWCLYGSYVMDRPRSELAENVAGRHNLLLLCPRQTKNDWAVAVTDQVPDHKSVSDYDTGYVFPLWQYGSNERTENFSSNFRTFLDARYDYRYTPEQVFAYIYAVLHVPAYRMRYAEFLRIDFPRIPLPENKSDFDVLSALGWDLVQAHLLKKLPPLKLAELEGKGNDTVDAVRYSPQEQTVWFNTTQSFKPVPQDVWEFHIGGYQVLEKYLKSRKGRELSLAEVEHVGDIARSLAFTIAQMAKIDTAYKAAFPDRG
ncbi:MAG TPA: type ISP restriction/modification enzyme [Terriglobales bacterium]|nr:type ISP restriction/modification enzyme [Terriglobales bacterium]